MQKTGPKSDIFHGFWSVFLMKFDEICIHSSARCDGAFTPPHAYFLIDVQKSHFSSNFEKVPKSMKNVRFCSGFLHVILKLIHQKDYSKKITLKTFVREKTSKSPYSRACCHGPVRGRAPWFIRKRSTSDVTQQI